MTLLAAALVGLIALLHVYILVLEMFLWTTPRAMKAFGTTPEPRRRRASWRATRACTTASWPPG